VVSRVTHFEIYGDAPDRLADFYREVLGWPIERAEGVDYWRIHLDPADNRNTSGGLTYRPSIPVSGWLQYVQVESLDVALAKAEQAGGRVLRERTAVPRTAWYAVLADPEGNVFAMWQPDPTAFPLPEPD
jgi:uncharacterized protein